MKISTPQDVDDLFEKLEHIDSALRTIVSMDLLLRNGNVVSAYRLGIPLFDSINSDIRLENSDVLRSLNRALVRMRKGEQVDALNDIKSTGDLLKQEKKNIYNYLQLFIKENLK